MKRRLVCLAFIASLVGLVWPSSVRGAEEQAVNDVWLNEIYTELDDDGDIKLEEDPDIKVQFELVGRPKSTGADAPKSMTATLKFYSFEGAIQNGEVTVTLEPSEEAVWKGNYVGVGSSTAVGAAFPEDNEAEEGQAIGGAVLSFPGGQSIVYCWGEHALDSDVFGTIGGDGDEQVCEVEVRATHMHPSEEEPSKGSGLYAKDNIAEGTKESDFDWKVTACSATADWQTIGTPNECATAGDAENDCVVGTVCEHGSQVLGAWAFEDISQVWLNEIHHVAGETGTKVEVLGRPTTQTEQMDVVLSFYHGTSAITPDVSLTLSSDSDNFASNFAATSTSDHSDAFAEGLGGVVLKYDDVEVVYCWGEDAETGSIGPENDRHECGRVVREDDFDAESPNSALYNKAARDETPEEGGTGEGDFEWKASVLTGTGEGEDPFFHTIGSINKCPDLGEGVGCTLSEQKLKEFEAPVDPDPVEEAEVWINEIHHLAEGKTSLEVVGRPAESSSPANIKVTLSFYEAGETTAEADHQMELVPNYTEFEGNYALTEEYDDVAGAFPAGGSGGVILKHGETEVVYCWGSGGGQIGEETCVNKIRDSDFTAVSPNSALYNKEGTPGEGGAKEEDFEWEDSVLRDGKVSFFETIGKVNKCPTGDELSGGVCSHTDQKLSPLGVPPNDNIVWLNELNVVGTGTIAEAVVSYELVGRPVKESGNPPQSQSVAVQFYEGTTAVGGEETVVLYPQSDGGWNGNFMGKVEGGEYGEAFPTGSIGGLTLTFETCGEERVYCWGDGAEEGATIGGSLKCQSVVTVEDMNIDGKKNWALWNEDNSGTAGEKASDFVWGESKGESAFSTIGSVNTCPTVEDCDTHDQVLLALEWPFTTTAAPKEEEEEEASGGVTHNIGAIGCLVVAGLVVGG